jgi:transcription elongation factor Elf1
LTNIDREKVSKKIDPNSEAIPIETKTLEDFKCGNCGLPLTIHVLWNGGKYERIVECKNCEISFPLEGNQKSKDSQVNTANNAKPKTGKKDSNDNKKESLVERLVKSW